MVDPAQYVLTKVEKLKEIFNRIETWKIRYAARYFAAMVICGKDTVEEQLLWHTLTHAFNKDASVHQAMMEVNRLRGAYLKHFVKRPYQHYAAGAIILRVLFEGTYDREGALQGLRDCL